MLTLTRVPPAQFDMFLKNSLGVLFFLFFLFQLAMSGLAFLISTTVSKASTGTNLGFAIFLVGWIMQVRSASIFSHPFTCLHRKAYIALHNCPTGQYVSCRVPPAPRVLTLDPDLQAVVIFGYPYTPAYYNTIPIGTALFALCPWTLLSKAILDLGHASAAGQAGISWPDRSR